MESAYVNELVMIVAEREVGKVAVQIKDNVTVDIHEEVASALLGIDETMNLHA